jgi:hypothetical protein
MLHDAAIRANHNLLFDVTGKNDTKMAENVQKLTALGYDVHIGNVQAPSHVVGWRAWKRYRDGAFTEKKGRFVPPDYAAKAVNGKPGGTYDRLKQMPEVKSWMLADTSGFETGGGPRVVDQGAK